MSCDKFRALLGPFRDGELSGVERRVVADHVRTCVACSGILDAETSLGADLAKGGAFTLPVGLEARVLAALDGEDARVRVETGMRPRQARFAIASPWAQAAAVAFACLLSAGGGWQAAHLNTGASSLAHDVLQAHVRALLQDNPVQVASSDSHTVRPWFAGKIEVAPNVRDLTAEGFPLVGGRLDYVGDTRVGVIVYKRHAHWVNVYMWPSLGAPDSSPVASERRGYNLVSWTRGGITHWAVSDLNLTELRQLQALI